MNFFKKMITAVLSASLLLTSITGASVYAVESEIASPESVASISKADLTMTVGTYSAETSAVTTAVNENTSETIVTTTAVTAAGAQKITIPAVTSNSSVQPSENGTEPSFNVFDIYDAHVKYLASTTTTCKATTTQIVTTTTKTINQTNVGNGIKGIDVSMWQGDIDWNQVKNSGVNYAIIRAGYGKYASQEDPKFDTNVINAQKAGIDCGVYWYSYATTVEEAYQEAEVCYSIIKDYNFEYPVFLDIEENSQRDLSTATVSAIIEAFCSTLENKGYYVGVYSYASFLNTKVYSSVLEKYDVWVAHFYVSQPSFSLPYGIWQYTDCGQVNGISENVDMDYAYKDYPYIISSNHKNGY